MPAPAVPFPFAPAPFVLSFPQLQEIDPPVHQAGVPVDVSPVFVAGRVAHAVEPQMQGVIDQAVDDLLAGVGQVDTRILQLVGHQQPVRVVDPGAAGTLQKPSRRLGAGYFLPVRIRLSLAGVQIHQHEVGLPALPVGPRYAVSAGVLIPVVGAEPEKGEPDIPGGVPGIPSAHGLHHLFRNDAGLLPAVALRIRFRFRAGTARDTEEDRGSQRQCHVPGRKPEECR